MASMEPAAATGVIHRPAAVGEEEEAGEEAGCQ